MGGPGVYEPLLPPMPTNLNAHRNRIGGYLSAKCGQNMSRYSGYHARMDPPDFLDGLFGRAGAYVSRTDPSDEFFAEVEGVLQDYFDHDGYPVHATTWFTKAKASIALELEETAAKINENAIIGGARYGTGIARAHAKELARKTAEIGVRYAELEFQGLTEAYNRELTAAGIGVELAKARSEVRFRWLGGMLQAGVDYWRAIMQREQIVYEDWRVAQYENRPAYRDYVQYAMSYPFQSHAPTVTPNPAMQLLQGLISGGSQVASAFALK